MVWFTILLATFAHSVLIGSTNTRALTTYNDMCECIMWKRTKMIRCFGRYCLSDPMGQTVAEEDAVLPPDAGAPWCEVYIEVYHIRGQLPKLIYERAWYMYIGLYFTRSTKIIEPFYFLTSPFILSWRISELASFH